MPVPFLILQGVLKAKFELWGSRHKGSPFPSKEGFVGDGALDIPFCWTLLGADDHWSSLRVAVRLCVVPHVLSYISFVFTGRRGAVPYKKIERLYVIPSKVEGSFSCHRFFDSLRSLRMTCFSRGAVGKI